MKFRFSIIVFPLVLMFFALSFRQEIQKEKHFKNLRQLTFGGDNAEAYFSPDAKKIVFQSNNPKWNLQCDQIFMMDLSVLPDTAFIPPMLSTGKGRTTCAFFMTGNRQILYSSTHLGSHSCPSTANLRAGGKYLWPVYNDYDIFVSDLAGNIIKQLTDTPGYDAEAVVSPKGDKIVFTSIRSGDLELWIMDIDGKNTRRLTHDLGYDGGAMFSPDGEKIVFRACRPETDEEINEYKENLAKGLVAPTRLEIFTMNVDGTGLQQVTNLGKANWSPCFHPSGKKIIFSSNHLSQKGYDFQLFMINTDGTGLEQITAESIFNSFPNFSSDGKYFVFCSNRNNGGTHDTNVFIAEWVE
ncbi:MAG: PD40 domain-containing protein [Bacteroidetes bacterium]|nr:PD40 domain-containing protein [Bacteroidota bacterium]